MLFSFEKDQMGDMKNPQRSSRIDRFSSSLPEERFEYKTVFPLNHAIFFQTKNLFDRRLTKDFFITGNLSLKTKDNVKFMIQPLSIVHLL